MSAYDPKRTLALLVEDFSQYDACPKLWGGNETTRVYHFGRWSGGNLAVRGACAAASDARGRVYQRCFAPALRAHGVRLSQRAQRSGLCREPERQNRISVGTGRN